MPKSTSIAELTQDMLAAPLTVQAVGMGLLLAEMRALRDAMPGALIQMPALAQRVAGADEADFDNMPI